MLAISRRCRISLSPLSCRSFLIAERTVRSDWTLPSTIFSRCSRRTMVSFPSSMKAVQISKTGGVDVLELRDLPIPSLSDGQVLVRNAFAGINYIDTYFRVGLYPLPSLPAILGQEASGTVVKAHPSAAESFPPGTRVVYMSRRGGFAEYRAVDAASLLVIPDALSLELAAAALLQGLTAWTLIREAAAVQAGQRALVHAAAGGTGSLLVQMLRVVGAKIIGTASSEEKRAIVKENGAGWALDSADEKLLDQVQQITGGHGVDVIFDGVGKATFDADLQMIALRGTLISFGNASGVVPPVTISKLSPKCVKLMRPTVFGYTSQREELVKHSTELFDLVASGKVKVKIYKVYELSDVAQAQTDIESRKTTGKLLLKCA